ncbi:MAG: transcriptional repressor [Candidatus Pacearchaeota archaeon]
MPKKSRNTRQKERLEEETKKFSSFFTPEDILKKVRKKDSKLGIATIYRFLKNKTTNNEIHTYTCDRKTIYSKNEKSHCHFTCEKCGKTEHLKVNTIGFIKNRVEGEICHFQIDVTGICNNCKFKSD